MSTRLRVLILGAIVFAPAWGAPVLQVQPATQTVGRGGTFTVDIRISGVTDLFAWQFNLGSNPAVLFAESIAEGPFLASGGSTFFIPGAIDNTAGTISFTADALLTAINGVDGGGTLATVSFRALASGSSSINIFSPLLLDSSLSGIDVTSEGGTVTVESAGQVPEPSLFVPGAGLLLVSFLAARRSSQSRRGNWWRPQKK